MKKLPSVIAVDFDGTCISHTDRTFLFEVEIGAAPVLRELAAAGHSVILFTMRHDETLARAVRWFADNGIELLGINRHPTQSQWTTSPKAFADLYIDDRALGIPLTHRTDDMPPHVSWDEVAHLLRLHGYLPPQVPMTPVTTEARGWQPPTGPITPVTTGVREPGKPREGQPPSGFTLLELLVTAAVAISLLCLLLTAAILVKGCKSVSDEGLKPRWERVWNGPPRP